MIKILAKRGYHHNKNDEEFTRHGDYARNIQYAVSKEFHNGREKVVDIVFLSVDVLNERLVIGFFRENLSVENGILQNTDTTIPLSKFTMEEFEKQLDRIIPKGNPLRNEVGGESF
ncbi:MAG: hypothetical protein FJ220_05655 [Kiritimatiellaceae bacterium]|nr:hypothetical protein [Kiritimatiellaceae bacterium]